MKNNQPTRRVRPFKRDKSKAIDSSYSHDGKIWQLKDANNQQIYVGDVLKYDHKLEEYRYVKVQKPMGTFSRQVFVTICDKHGEPLRDRQQKTYSFNIAPEYLDLNWRGEPFQNLLDKQPQQQESYEKRQAQKAYDKRAAAIKIKTMRDRVQPEFTDGEIMQIARDISVDFDYVRKHRDSLIAEQITPEADHKKLQLLSGIYPMSVERMTKIRDQKKGAPGHAVHRVQGCWR